MTRRELFTRWLKESVKPEPISPPKPDPRLLPGFLRPPGAAEEAKLVSLCERCHKCADACPHDVILPLGPAYGEAEGTPAILPRGGPCRLCDDLPCAAACPSGALKPVPIYQVWMGIARLDPALCWAVKKQPCDYCVKECPLGEAALRWNDDRPEVVEEECVGCGMCVHICAATPSALTVVPPRS
jgi:ferredoxin